MRTVITAIQVAVETSVYNEDNKLVSRTRPEVVAFEADIPEAIVQWLSEQVAKRGA